MDKRNTVQRALVLKTVKALQSHASADEIYNTIVKEYPDISRGTVYRNLNLLCEMGEIQKREIPGGADRFDHICGNHYHAKCNRCGRIFDVDMDYIAEMEKAIKNTHGFVFTGHDIVFKGICPECNSTLDPDNPKTIL